MSNKENYVHIFILLPSEEASQIAAGAQLFPEDIPSPFPEVSPVGSSQVYLDRLAAEFSKNMAKDVAGEEWDIVEMQVDKGRLMEPDNPAEKDSMRFLTGGIRGGDFVQLYKSAI